MPRATRSSARKSSKGVSESETSNHVEEMDHAENQDMNGTTDNSNSETEEQKSPRKSSRKRGAKRDPSPEKMEEEEEKAEVAPRSPKPSNEEKDESKEEPMEAAPKEGAGETEEAKDDPDHEAEPAEEEQEEAKPAEPEVWVDRDRRVLAKMPTVKDSKLAELDKYWKPIKEDPYDFTGWTYLLQFVDQGEDVEAAVEAYSEFLSRYPYCYGYWKKYADFLKKRHTVEAAEEVFEKGLKAIPLSVDLWLHYLNHMKSTYDQEEGGESRIREALERAADACGLEFRSGKFWEFYTKWETEKGGLKNVMKVYDRLLTVPNAQYQTQFQSLKDFVGEHNPKDLLDVDEFIALRKLVLEEFRAAHGLEPVAPAAAAAPADDDTDVPPGDEDAPPGVEGEGNIPVQKSDEETKAIREKLIASRTDKFNALDAEVKKRLMFEDALKRPYFHVKPLERNQLKTWKDYLDFEVKEGDKERIRVLFERCFIACALYEELWLKYVDYLKSIKASDDEISSVFERACSVHLRRKLSINLQWALFEERRSGYEKSMQILTDIEDYFGECLAIAIRKIGLARRAKKFDQVEHFYRHFIDFFVKKGDKAQANGLIVKHARFVAKFLNDKARSRTIVEEALNDTTDNPRLYMHLIDLMMEEAVANRTEIVAVFDKALASSMSNDVKMLFAHRKMEFLEDFGDDAAECESAYDQYSSFVSKTKEARKRANEESSDHGDAKKPKMSKPTTASPAAAPSAGGRSTTSPAASAYPYGSAAAAPSYSAGYPQSSAAYPYGAYGAQTGAGYYGGAGATAAAHYGYSNPYGQYSYYGQR